MSDYTTQYGVKTLAAILADVSSLGYAIADGVQESEHAAYRLQYLADRLTGLAERVDSVDEFKTARDNHPTVMSSAPFTVLYGTLVDTIGVLGAAIGRRDSNVDIARAAGNVSFWASTWANRLGVD